MADDDSPLTFPCRFPVKAMGRNEPAFEAFVTEIVRTHAGTAALLAVDSRASRNGRYLAVTVTFTATGRDQVDDIYRTLTASGQVLYLL